jgi:hypothetical protein
MARVFIVGNGPSLKPWQLDKIKGEVSYGVNRIHLIYPETAWRPDHWFFMDFSNSSVPVYKQDIELHSQQGYPCYVRSDIVAKFIERYVGEQAASAGTSWNINARLQNIKVVEQCNHIDCERNPASEWHFPGICKQGGSVSGAIQHAVMGGHNPIYLIGCDGDMKGNAENHFIKGYIDPDGLTVQRAIIANKTLEMAHKIAFKECRSRGIKIFNATVGGSKISGIPLADFGSLFLT